MTSSSGFHHNSTFSSGNRPFKGKSKGKRDQKQRGKVQDANAPSSTSAQAKAAHAQSIKAQNSIGAADSKQARHNRSKQIQAAKRSQAVTKARVGATTAATQTLATATATSFNDPSALNATQTRLVSSGCAPPKTVALLSLSPRVSCQAIVDAICSHCGVTTSSASFDCSPALEHADSAVRTVTVSVAGQSVRLQLLSVARERNAALDAAKVADLILCVLGDDASQEDLLSVDSIGAHLMTVLKVQGLPTVMGLVHQSREMSQSSAKRQAAFRKNAHRYFETQHGAECKVVDLQHAEADTSSDANSAFDSQRLKQQAEYAALCRCIASSRISGPKWRESRAYMLCQHYEFKPNQASDAASTIADSSENDSRGTLFVRGFIRGNRRLDANELMHITGFDDYAIDTITGLTPEDEAQLQQQLRHAKSARAKIKDTDAQMNCDDESHQSSLVKVLQRSQPELQHSLDSMNQSLDNGLNNEQSLITEEEMMHSDDNSDSEQEEDDEMSLNQHSQSKSNSAQSAAAIPAPRSHTEAWHSALGLSDDEQDAKQLNSDDDEDADSSAKLDSGEAASASSAAALSLEKKKLERDDELDFPDQVEFPIETVCRHRFQRYRGLKSFKDSEWDECENLPESYSRIFTFQQLKATQHRIMNAKQSEETISSERGTPVTIALRNVKASDWLQFQSQAGPRVLFNLFEHERKVSVSHMLLSRMHEDESVLGQKEELEFHCAFRRYTARPIYTHPSKHSKHLTQRFFQQNRYTQASVFARIIFPPAPVLVFRPEPERNHAAEALGSCASSDQMPILATGRLSSIDPHRLLIKRIILTGSPISVHKRCAVVRHMFFNAPDIAWFKPVELVTRHGLVGHIQCSRGTKGYMKCEFDGFIQNHDTVCMMLYKRQFPPFDEAKFQ